MRTFVKMFISSLILGLIFIIELSAQTFVVNPATGYLPGKSTPSVKLFYKAQDSLILTWSKDLASSSNSKIKIGTSPGNYGFKSIDASGKRKSFIPGNSPLQLPVGRYYAIITNSSATTLGGIQSDYLANPTTINYSNEVQFVVESPNAAYAVDPRGSVTSSTPTFSWNPVSGVTAYWIITSSTPFDVVTDSSGNPTVQGANIVWDYITTGTSALYGQISPASPFTTTAIPLFPGNQYYYTLINMYDATNIAFASSVFGGIVTFTYTSSATIQPPVLIAPANNTTFNGDQNITFRWDPVSGANSYTIHLFNRVTQFAGGNQEIDLPIWNSTTTNTQISYPAKVNLTKGKYSWFVVPNSTTGAGNKSVTNVFNYYVPLGKFRVESRNAENNSSLLGYSFTIQSTTGGFSPAQAIVVTNSTAMTDSIPADTYIFTGKKEGYYDSSFTVTLNTSSTVTQAILYLRPYPAIVSGTVKKSDGTTIDNATVRFQNNSTGAIATINTNVSGGFSYSTSKGTYTVQASKAGYKASDPRTVNVDTNQIIISSPFVLVLDEARISGFVLNDENLAVQLATVKATQGSVVQSTTTNESGNYNLVLSSGTWIVEVEKTGFLSPSPRTYQLSVGDNLLNQNFILTPKANQVTGFVSEIINQTGSVPSANVTVTATPSSGQAVSAVTNSGGQYSLSLKAGSYIITAAKSGYSVSSSHNLTLTIGQTVSGVNFSLTPNPSSVSGMVKDQSGNAIQGATVSSGSVSVQTTANGNYTLSLPTGNHTINVQKSGFISPSPISISLTVGQNISGINFQLSPNAGVISGTITSLGEVVPGATITATRNSVQTTQTSNQNGVYTFSVQPGTYTLVVSKAGFVTSAATTITVAAGQTSSNNNFALVSNTAVLKGVVTSSNNPLSAATVNIVEVGNSSNNYSSPTNVNGDYTVTVTAGKSYSIAVSKTGYSSSSQTTSTLTAGTNNTFNFSLNQNPASVKGKIISNTNQVLTNATVELVNTSTSAVITSTTSDLNGDYTIGTAAGSFKIRARKEGYKKDSINVTISAGQTLTGINFTLQENFSVISGTIKEGNGSAIADALINISNNLGGASATSTTSGNYVATIIVPGSYNVTVQKTGFKDTTISNYILSGGQSITLNIVMQKLAGTISGTVKDAGGQNISGASVFATATGGTIYSATTNASGSYQITALPLQGYTVNATKSSYLSTQQISVTLSSSSTTGTANINDFVLNIGALNGTIKDQNGNGLLDATVSVSGTQGSASSQTSTTGNYSITNLAPGNYNVAIVKSGYTVADTTITLPNSTLTLNRTMQQNTGSISGTIRNQAGSTLIITGVQVKAISNQQVYTTTMNNSGNYSFSGVELNKSYTILTDIFREGFVNDSASVTIDNGGNVSGTTALVVEVNHSHIKGTAGTDNAAMRLVNTATGETKTTLSATDGSYNFGFLPNGTFTISATKNGFVFSPVQTNVTLAVRDTSTTNFASTPNVGNIKVSAKNSTNAPMSIVDVSAVNTTSNAVSVGVTDNSGEYNFNNLPAGNYLVRATKSGFSANPESIPLNLNNQDNLTAQFTMTANSSSVAGKVSRKVGTTLTDLSDATVRLFDITTGQTITTQTGSNGTYAFNSIAAGSKRIIASKTGFISDTLEINIVQGSNLTNQNLELLSNTVKLNGSVTYNSSGLAGITVQALSSFSTSTITGSDGKFSFVDLPLNDNPADTTVYEIRISGASISEQSIVERIPGSAAGQTVTMNPFTIPSGQIIITATDGSAPLAGVKVVVTSQSGSASNLITSTNGKTQTSATLKSGVYDLKVSIDGYLSPDATSTRITLASDTTKYNASFKLPYMHDSAKTINIAQATDISVGFVSVPAKASAKLFFKKESDLLFTEVALTLGTSSFFGSIPATTSLEKISYYVQAIDTLLNTTFTSDVYELQPTAVGVLRDVELNPSINQSIFRKGEEYSFNLFIKDGANNSLLGKFSGTGAEGKTSWESDDATAVQVSFPNANDSTVVKLKPLKDGIYKMKITSQLKGVVITKEYPMEITSLPIQDLKLTVGGNAQKISNKSSGIQINLSVSDSSNRKMFLGNSISWSVSPSTAAAISNEGVLTFSDTNYIGLTTVKVSDNISGKTASVNVKIFATLVPGVTYTLTDKEGMTFTIPSGAISDNLEIWMDEPSRGPGKKNFARITDNKTFVSGDNTYNFISNTAVPLPGDSLLANATLNIPLDNSLSFFEGEKYIGYYDTKINEWKILSGSTQSGSVMTYSTIRQIGQYAVVAENLALGIKYFSVLPSPFSPEVAPLKIGYFLNSLLPPVGVTIKIYNIRGELVRTLLENDLQMPGRYGSRTANKEILWDGKTDNGEWARNGRYIIHFNGKDSSGEINELIQVVLVK